jgi:hypothetical protein
LGQRSTSKKYINDEKKIIFKKILVKLRVFPIKVSKKVS